MKEKTINFVHYTLYSISAFLPASCPHRCLVVACYDFASDAVNMLETNSNLAQILMTDMD